MMIRRRSGTEESAADASYGSGGVATMSPADPAEDQPTEKKSWLQSVMQFEITKKKVPRKDLMHFSRQMAVFIKAGIPILEAIDGITEEMGNKKYKEYFATLSQQLDTLAGVGSSTVDSVLTDAGVPHLAELTSLRLLDIRDTEITDAGLAALSVALPLCAMKK